MISVIKNRKKAKKMPINVYLLQYLCASSNMSFILIEIIIPATNNKIKLIIVSDINLYKNKYAIKAPNGSDKPLRKTLINDFFLEPRE